MIHNSLRVYKSIKGEDKQYRKSIDSALCMLAQKGNNKALDILIKRHLGLCHKTILRYAGAPSDKEDLFQSAMIGLMRAAKNFTPDAGAQFSTYGEWWIRAGATRCIHETGSTIKIPVNKNIAFSKANRKKKSNGKELSREDVEALEVFDRVKCLSIDKPLSDDGKTLAEILPGGDLIDDVEGPDEELQREVALLPEPGRTVIALYFGLNNENPETLQSIGDRLGLTRERIRQIKETTLRKLRIALTREMGRIN